MSNPTDLEPTDSTSDAVRPPAPRKDPIANPGGEVPKQPNPYMGGGGIPA